MSDDPVLERCEVCGAFANWSSTADYKGEGAGSWCSVHLPLRFIEASAAIMGVRARVKWRTMLAKAGNEALLKARA